MENNNNAVDITKVEKSAKLTDAQEQAVKGFTTGYGITPDTQLDAGALRREFLQSDLVMQTWTQEDLSFYRDVTRVPVQSTVVKYDVYLAHGRVGSSLFTNEIGVSEVNDPSIRQRTVNMKYLSDTKNISIATTLVNNIEDPLEILTEDAMATIAKTIEWASFYGDGDLSDDTAQDTGLEFHGLAKLIDKDNVLDLRGAKITEADLNKASVMVAKGFGRPTDAYMPIGVHADFVNTLLSRQVQVMSQNGQNVTTGYNVQGFNSARGFIRLHGSSVMELENILNPFEPLRSNAPHPAKVTATVATASEGKFRQEEIDRGSLEYRVVVHANGAKSQPSDIVTATVANKTDGVKLEIDLTSMYAQRPQFVSVYRKGLNTEQFYLIERIPASAMVNYNIEFIDRNENIAETADIFMGEMSGNVVNLFELLPMLRLPLARTNATDTFAVLWYGALALRAPKKWVRIKNVSYIATDNVFNEIKP